MLHTVAEINAQRLWGLFAGSLHTHTKGYGSRCVGGDEAQGEGGLVEVLCGLDHEFLRLQRHAVEGEGGEGVTGKGHIDTVPCGLFQQGDHPVLIAIVTLVEGGEGRGVAVRGAVEGHRGGISLSQHTFAQVDGGANGITLGHGHGTLHVVILGPHILRQRQGGEVEVVVAQHQVDDILVLAQVDGRELVVVEEDIGEVDILAQVDALEEVTRGKEPDEVGVMAQVDGLQLAVGAAARVVAVEFAQVGIL